MLVVIALMVVISYWPIHGATIELRNSGTTLTELDGLLELEHWELVRMLFSELNMLKEEQKAMINVQSKLLATQDELRNRVNELETKNLHLQSQFESLLNSCGTGKKSESNLTDGFRLQSHGNVKERSMTNVQGNRAGNIKTGMVRGVFSPHISFLARQTNTESSFSHGQTVIFDTLYENLGNGYNPNNGIFRAPVAGLYIILLTVASDGTRSPDVEVVLDGSVLCRVVTTLYWVGSSCNIIVHFNEGDNVWAKIEYDYTESRIRGAYFSTFSIGLLSSD